MTQVPKGCGLWMRPRLVRVTRLLRLFCPWCPRCTFVRGRYQRHYWLRIIVVGEQSDVFCHTARLGKSGKTSSAASDTCGINSRRHLTLLCVPWSYDCACLAARIGCSRRHSLHSSQNSSQLSSPFSKCYRHLVVCTRNVYLLIDDAVLSRVLACHYVVVSGLPRPSRHASL